MYYADTGIFTPGQQYTQVPNQPSNLRWKSMSISKGSIYGIDTTGKGWYNSNYKSGTWTNLVGGDQFYASHRMTSV
jgi:hypothetical protein